MYMAHVVSSYTQAGMCRTLAKDTLKSTIRDRDAKHAGDVDDA